MNAEQLIFYFFAIMLLLSALIVVTSYNLVRSIFLFFVTLFALAAIYVFALADFIALTQVVLYAGGVLVLMLFAFMLSNKELLNALKPVKNSFKLNHFLGVFIALAFLLILLRLFLENDFSQLEWIKSGTPISKNDNTIHAIGIQSMTRYLLPFEILSVFLMMSLVGAAHLARKGKKI
jgi:NAD(P)H-quinone oxidoreductase subunit 6